MKHWFSKNYKTLIIAAFLIPILTVAVVSISHVTQWYGISNPVSWSVYLSVGIEIAALSALAAISANMGSKVYFPFAIVTLVQFIGNIFFAYSYIDIDSKQFKDWVDLVAPLVEFIGVDPNDFVGHKRFLALFAGGMLPIISLSFLHMLVKFTEEDRNKEEKIIFEEEKHLIDDKIIQEAIEKYKKEQEQSTPEDLKDFVDESTRIRLSEEDLKILEDTLLNPPQPNDKLKQSTEKYKETQKEALTEMMKNDQELGLYDEPFENSVRQYVEEMMLTTNSDTIESISMDEETPMVEQEKTQLQKLQDYFNPTVSDDFTIGPDGAFEMTEEILEDLQKEIIETPNDEISDWDVTLLDGLDEEENFSTMELNRDAPEFEIPNQDGWDEPTTTPEEVEFKIDVQTIEPTQTISVVIDEEKLKPFDVDLTIENTEEDIKPSFEIVAEKKNL
jgi:hypothetical protein